MSVGNETALSADTFSLGTNVEGGGVSWRLLSSAVDGRISEGSEAVFLDSVAARAYPMTTIEISNTPKRYIIKRILLRRFRGITCDPETDVIARF